MPYVDEPTRVRLDEWLSTGAPKGGPKTPGELNYVLTSLIVDYLGWTPNYAKFNEAIGVLECAKLELYRRLVVPYEDTKKEENGDVYW